MEHAIEIRNLSVRLPGFALSDIDMDIPKGCVTGLVGKNGAGKTTLIQTITDLYLPYKGIVSYGGLMLNKDAQTIKNKMAVVYDSLCYPADWSAVKTAKWAAKMYPYFDMEKWQKLMERFEINATKKTGCFSKGMKTKFMFAMALARDPEILILDEPTAGLDPAARAELLELIQEFMMDEEKTVIFSTHITSDLEKIADYIALIAEGHLVLMEEKDSLLERYAVVQIGKEAMTDELSSKMTGVRENSFGYTGLTSEKEIFLHLPGAKVKRAEIEDLLIYGEGGNRD